jgi:hypothetical protein
MLLSVSTIALIFFWSSNVTKTVPSDLHLRAWSAFLQLLGVATVWTDLTGTANSFGRGSIWTRTWQWLKTGLFGKNIILSGTGSSSGSSSASGRIKVRWPINATASLPERIYILELNLQKIDESLDAFYKEFDKFSAKLNTNIAKEVQERQQVFRILESRLNEALTGNFTVLAFGAIWLAVGIVIGMFASEIAKISI